MVTSLFRVTTPPLIILRNGGTTIPLTFMGYLPPRPFGPCRRFSSTQAQASSISVSQIPRSSDRLPLIANMCCTPLLYLLLGPSRCILVPTDPFDVTWTRNPWRSSIHWQAVNKARIAETHDDGQTKKPGYATRATITLH